MRKNLVAFSALAISVALLMGVIGLSPKNYSSVIANEEDFIWNHYSYIAPTDEDNGVKEYYVCCDNHEHVFERPSVGIIQEGAPLSAEFRNSLPDDDDRVILSYQKQASSLNNEIAKLPEDDGIAFEDGIRLRQLDFDYISLPASTQSSVTNISSLRKKMEIYNSTYNCIIDGNQLTVRNCNYGSNYGFEYENDQEHFIGNILTLKDVASAGSSDQFWIQLTSSADLSIYSNVYFYVKFSISRDFSIRVGNDDYAGTKHLSSHKDEWILVSLSLNEIPALTNTSLLGLGVWFGNSYSFGYLSISSIYGKPKNVNRKDLIFDASKETFTANDYPNDAEYSHVHDESKGEVLKASNLVTTNDAIWLKPSIDLDISTYAQIYFYFKSSVSIQIDVRETKTYNVIESVNVAANSWEKVIIDVNETHFTTGNLNDLGISFWGSQSDPATLGDWYFSSIYGVGYKTNGKYQKIDDYIIPKIESAETVKFTAYGVPPTTSTNAHSVFQTLKNARFSKGIGLYDGRDGDQEAFRTALRKYLSKTGDQESNRQALFISIDNFCQSIEAANQTTIKSAKANDIGYYALNVLQYDFRDFASPYICSPQDYMMIMNRILEKSLYIDSEDYYGQYYIDEPSVIDDFSIHKNFIEAYKTKVGNRDCEVFMNLLPFGVDGNRPTYEQYLDNYFQKIFGLLGYVSFDKYPLLASGIEGNHLLNLEMMANRIKNHGNTGELRTFIHSTSQDSIVGNDTILKVDSKKDLSFQIYSALAFGATDISYFMYSSNQDISSNGNIGGLTHYQNNSTNEIYKYASSINEEVLSFAKTYRCFKWDQTLVSGASSALTKIATNQNSYGSLTSFSSNKDTLIGCFSGQENRDAFIVMNYQDPNALDSSSALVELVFNHNNVNCALVFKDGKKNVYPLIGNRLNLNLEAAQGAFVVPLRCL